MEATSALRVRSLSLVAGLGAITLTAGAAFGQSSPVDMSMDWSVGSQNFTFDDLYAESDEHWVQDGLQFMAGARGAPVPGMDGPPPRGNTDENWGFAWTVSTNLNARGTTETVTANLNVFNNDPVNTQTFFVLTTKNGLAPIGPFTTTDGSVSATIDDLGNDGAEMSNISNGGFSGDPIYESLIDNTTHEDLWPAGFALTAAPGASAADSNTFDNVTGSGVNDSIGVFLKIEVSPFDTVSLNGTFSVTAIPTPAALPALGLFGLAAGRRRRRRS